MLIEAALEALPADVHKVELEVFPDNAAAIGLYRSLGFEQEGLRRDHYRREDGSPALGADHGAPRSWTEARGARAPASRRGRPDRLLGGLDRDHARARPPSARVPPGAQLRRATTGPAESRAWPISESVPHSPPTAITASPRGDDGEVAGVADRRWRRRGCSAGSPPRPSPRARSRSPSPPARAAPARRRLHHAAAARRRRPSPRPRPAAAQPPRPAAPAPSPARSRWRRSRRPDARARTQGVALNEPPAFVSGEPHSAAFTALPSSPASAPAPPPCAAVR